MYTDDPKIRVCVWCAEKNDTPNLLCSLCEARATLLNEKRGVVHRRPDV